MAQLIEELTNDECLFPEREYKCLGSWEEKDGVTYSFTHRRDVHGFQCFVSIHE